MKKRKKKTMNPLEQIGKFELAIVNFALDYALLFGKDYGGGFSNIVKDLYCDFMNLYGSEDESLFKEKILNGDLFDKIFEMENKEYHYE